MDLSIRGKSIFLGLPTASLFYKVGRKMKKHIATYTVTVPVTFQFRAGENLEGEKLFKMAENYLELAMKNGLYAYLPQEVKIIDKEIHYSKEELEQQKREREEWYREIGVNRL